MTTIDFDYIRKAWSEIQDKQLAMVCIRSEVLASSIDELSSLMALRGMRENMPGYSAFAFNFASNKIRDAKLAGVLLPKGIK
jgi:hypothetical protein